MSENIVISEKPVLFESYSYVGEGELILFYNNSEKLKLGSQYTFHIKSTSKRLELISYEKID